MGFLGWWKGPSGYSSRSTSEEVTHGIDGSGLTAIVTGASSGLGAETTRVLALRGVHVIMAVRNTTTGAKVKEDISKQVPQAKIHVMELDLSSMESVRNFASEFKAMGLPLNILINNGGICGLPFALSKDNIEMHFATNHLGHFLLTNLLLDTMKKTATGSKREGRIINVSSSGHFHAEFKEDVTFNKITDKSIYEEMPAYCFSKLCNVLHANELAKRLKEEGVNITANSLHPGIIMTEILRHNKFITGFFNTIGRLMLRTVQQGAATTCYLALNPQVEGVTGEYFVDCNVAKPSSLSQGAELAKKLWDFSTQLTDKQSI